MKVSDCLVVILLVGPGIAGAQAPDTLWTRVYGGNGPEGASSVQHTSDGGSILAASSTSTTPGNRDWWIIKTDADGDTLWTKSFGGPEGDLPVTARQTNDGGYIIAGLFNPVGADSANGWIIKTNANGDSVWSRQFSTPYLDLASYAAQNPDNTYIIAGARAGGPLDPADVYLQKLNSSGNNIWTQTFEFGGVEGASSAQRTADGGYIVIGLTTPILNINVDAYLIKTNGTGGLTWEQTFGGDSTDLALSIQQTSDNGYIFCGSTRSSGAGASDAWVVKTNSSGVQTWARTYGGEAPDLAASVKQTSDGGYIVVGVTSSFGVDSSAMWILKLASNGDTLWTKIIDGPDDDGAAAIDFTADGNYIITGATESFGADSGNVWLVKLASCFDPTPGAPQIVSRRTGDDLRITWRAIRQSVINCPIIVDHYDVYMDSVVTGPFESLIGTTADTTMIVPDILNIPLRATHFYRVFAIIE